MLWFLPFNSREVKWPLINKIHMTPLHSDSLGWRLIGQEALTSPENTRPPHSAPETFDGALAFLKRDRRSKAQIAQSGNPPNIPAFQRSCQRYITTAANTWRGRLVLHLRAYGTLDCFHWKFLTGGGRAASNICLKWLLQQQSSTCQETHNTTVLTHTTICSLSVRFCKSLTRSHSRGVKILQGTMYSCTKTQQ